MPSLTPQYRSGEATEAAMTDGLIAGGITLIPTSAAVWAASHSPKFMKVTNYQSRTALVVMPALFMFAFSSESKLLTKMHEIANQSEHSKNMAEYAQKQQEERMRKDASSLSTSTLKNPQTMNDAETQMRELYKKSVEESGVRIVPGDTLGPHHVFSNFWQEHPFKLLTIIGVPTVLYIFKGRNEKKHLQLQSKLMHTRVLGQFAVISLLLTLMGYKEYMDKYGKFITQADADQRVYQMQRMREDLLARLEHDKQVKEHREKLLKKAQLKRDETYANLDDKSKQKLIKKEMKKKMKEVVAIENA